MSSGALLMAQWPVFKNICKLETEVFPGTTNNQGTGFVAGASAVTKAHAR